MSKLSEYTAKMTKLTEKLTKLSEVPGQKQDNANFWYPAVDKSGNGSAVIRFLPPRLDEDEAIVRRWTHAFKGPTGLWYIENSRTSLGERDPVSEMNSILWNSGDQETARNRKRNLEFFANVYIIKDRENPQNEGKVFIFKFGKKIFDKIQAVMTPEFDDDPSVNPFDLLHGANFKLKIRTKDGYRNYDDSQFDPPSKFLNGDEDTIEAVLDNLHPLNQFVRADQFKSYDELKIRLNQVLGVEEVEQDFSPPRISQKPQVSQQSQGGSKRARMATPEEEDDILAKLKMEIEELDR